MRLSKESILIGIGIVAGVSAILAAAGVFVFTQPIWSDGGSSQSPAVDAARLETHTKKFSEEFVPRNWTHTENLNRAASYIHDEFARAGAPAVQYQGYAMDGGMYRNVMVQLGADSNDDVTVRRRYGALRHRP